ncbi:MAG: TolB family protein [Negativicutes bacterium]
MTEQYRRLRKYIFIFAATISCIVILYLWRNGAFLQLPGYLIISASPYNIWNEERKFDSRKVISIPLDGQYVSEKFFDDSRYGEIRLSYRKDTEDVYSAKNIAANYYTVLSVQNNQIIELMRSDKPIIFPFIATSRDKIIFISPTNMANQEYHLYQYRLDDKIISRVSALQAVFWSKPIFSPDGRIIFATVDKYRKAQNGNIMWAVSTIVEIGKNGEETKLVSGIFPTWLEEGRSFLFFDRVSKQLKLYDARNKDKITVIKDEVRIMTHPALSPDKKFLAFHEIITYGPDVNFGGSLQVMTVGGWVKLLIKQANSPLYNKDGVGTIWWSK